MAADSQNGETQNDTAWSMVAGARSVNKDS